MSIYLYTYRRTFCFFNRERRVLFSNENGETSQAERIAQEAIENAQQEAKQQEVKQQEKNSLGLPNKPPGDRYTLEEIQDMDEGYLKRQFMNLFRDLPVQEADAVIRSLIGVYQVPYTMAGYLTGVAGKGWNFGSEVVSTGAETVSGIASEVNHGVFDGVSKVWGATRIQLQKAFSFSDKNIVTAIPKGLLQIGMTPIKALQAGGEHSWKYVFGDKGIQDSKKSRYKQNIIERTLSGVITGGKDIGGAGVDVLNQVYVQGPYDVIRGTRDAAANIGSAAASAAGGLVGLGVGAMPFVGSGYGPEDFHPNREKKLPPVPSLNDLGNGYQKMTGEYKVQR